MLYPNWTVSIIYKYDHWDQITTLWQMALGPEKLSPLKNGGQSTIKCSFLFNTLHAG